MLRAKNKEGGFASNMILIVVVAVLIIGGIGYTVMSKQKDSSGSSSKSVTSSASSKALRDECNKKLNDKEFCTFAGNWSGLTSYKSTITSTTAEGTSTYTMEMDGNDKSRMKTIENGKETGEFVTIGKTFYTKDMTDGSWTAFTDDSKTTTTKSKETFKISDFTDSKDEKDTTSYKKIGKDPCGKLTCYKYQIVDTARPNAEEYIWFDTKDFLMRRWYSKEGSDTTDMTISYEKVTITTPSPVKSTTTSSSNAAALQADMDAAMQDTQPAEEE